MTPFDRVVDGSIIGCKVQVDTGCCHLIFYVEHVRRQLDKILVDGVPTTLITYSIGYDNQSYMITPASIKIVENAQ